MGLAGGLQEGAGIAQRVALLGDLLQRLQEDTHHSRRSRSLYHRIAGQGWLGHEPGLINIQSRQLTGCDRGPQIGHAAHVAYLGVGAAGEVGIHTRRQYGQHSEIAVGIRLKARRDLKARRQLNGRLAPDRTPPKHRRGSGRSQQHRSIVVVDGCGGGVDGGGGVGPLRVFGHRRGNRRTGQSVVGLRRAVRGGLGGDRRPSLSRRRGRDTGVAAASRGQQRQHRHNHPHQPKSTHLTSQDMHPSVSDTTNTPAAADGSKMLPWNRSLQMCRQTRLLAVPTATLIASASVFGAVGWLRSLLLLTGAATVPLANRHRRR